MADALLEPTVIYVRAVLTLLRSGLPVHGLAHITGGGLLNLGRLNADVGFEVTDPLPVPPVFGLVRDLGGVPDADADAVVAGLSARHPGTARIGRVTDRAGQIERS